MEDITLKMIDSTDSLKKCAALLAEAYNAPPWQDNWTEEKAFEKLNFYFNSPNFYGLMAFQGDKIAGGCVGNIEPYFTGNYFFLKDMFVSVGSQRQGVGSRLIMALREYLDSSGVNTIILFTSNQHFTYDFYMKNDFKIMEGICMMHYGPTD